MNQYDVLKDTWIYREIRQQIEQEAYIERVAELRRILVEIVQGRFPRLEMLTKNLVDEMNEATALQDLIVKAGTMRTEKEIRRCLDKSG
jgi:hypothetical protein